MTSLGPPPIPFKVPKLSTIKAKTELFRVHELRFGSLGFNPTAAVRRFRPVRDDAGSVVPTLYAGLDFDTAVWEGVFHDIEPQGQIAFSKLQGTADSIFSLEHDLKLFPAQDPECRVWKVRGSELTGAPPADYAVTAKWAQAMYDADSTAAGIQWMSRQNNSGTALILWEDRIDPSLATVIQDSRPLDSGQGLEDVYAAAERGNVTIIHP
jgi:hypothetical protein